MDCGGTAALVKLALMVEERLGLEVLSLGANELVPRAACVGEFCGKLLLYTVAIDAELIYLLTSPMDTGDQLELILSVADTPENWKVVFRLLRALEWSGLSVLAPRPLSIGPPAGGPDSFVLA